MPRHRTRWFLRFCLASLLAVSMWWMVSELLAPQPLFSFPLHGEAHIASALVVGPWCIMDLDGEGPIRPIRYTSVYDSSSNTFSSRDRRFGSYDGGRGNMFVQIVYRLKNCLNRYVFQRMTASSFRLYDTINDDVKYHEFQSNSSIETNDACTHVWDVTKLPVSSFLALSTGPLASLPGCWLTAEKDQLPTVENVITLVQVHQLPKMTITSRFSLPPYSPRSALNLTASGKYLVRYYTVEEQFDERVLHWDYSVRPDEWMKSRINRLKLDDMPPEAACRCEVFDAHTGSLVHSNRITYQGKPIRYFCSPLRQDWAFLWMAEPWQVKSDEVSSQKRLSPLFCALHLPTGRQIPADQLPPNFWDRWQPGLVASGIEGSALGSAVVHENPSLINYSRLFRYRASDEKSRIELYRFNADGTARKLKEFNMSFPGLMPEQDQYYTIASRFSQLPRWLTAASKYWLWLRNKLMERTLLFIDADSGSTRWAHPLDNEEDWRGPRVIVTADGGQLLIPVSTGNPANSKTERHRFDVYVYRLPISSWINTGPLLAALAVFILWMSQGFAWFRWFCWKTLPFVGHAIWALWFRRTRRNHAGST